MTVGQLDLDELRAAVAPISLRRYLCRSLRRRQRWRAHLHRQHRCNRRRPFGLKQSLPIQLPPGKYLVRVYTMPASDGGDRCAAHMRLLHNPALLFNRVPLPRPRSSPHRVGCDILLGGCVHVVLCGHLAGRAHVGHHGQRQSAQLLGNPRTVTIGPMPSTTSACKSRAVSSASLLALRIRCSASMNGPSLYSSALEDRLRLL